MATSADTATSAPLRWGVLSTANIGVKSVMPGIRAARNGELVALASRDQARAERIVAGEPAVRAYGSYEELLADPNVEAVYISLPNALHEEWTVRAARAGKHVLCEKPLGATPDEVRRMIAACRAAGVVLMEAFMYRFHPQIRWALEQLASDAIGPVRLARGGFAFDIRTRPGDIRLLADMAGGSLMDVGCYPLNFCRAVFGGPPVAVAARVDVPEGSAVEQTVGAVLDFGQGRFGIIDSSFQLPWHQFVEVVGELGRLEIPLPFTPGRNDTCVRLVRGDETLEQRFAGVDQYQLEVEHFADCVRQRKTPDLPPEDALEQAEAIDAIYKAAGFAIPW